MCYQFFIWRLDLVINSKETDFISLSKKKNETMAVNKDN